MGQIVNLAAVRAERVGRRETRESLQAMAAIWEAVALTLEERQENSQFERSQAYRLKLEAAKFA